MVFGPPAGGKERPDRRVRRRQADERSVGELAVPWRQAGQHRGDGGGGISVYRGRRKRQVGEPVPVTRAARRRDREHLVAAPGQPGGAARPHA
jgi:hypothetical protein